MIPINQIYTPFKIAQFLGTAGKMTGTFILWNCATFGH